ncbi:MAG: hypothetical protein ACI4HI_12635 [Lachnospiraceae bacterium]
MPVEKDRQDMNDVLQKANRILEDCSAYMTERMEDEQIDTLSGIRQVERIFDFQSEFFIVHHEAYVRLKKYEDMLFLETDQREYYQNHLQCLQNCRASLVKAIACGVEDGSIRKEIDPKQEAAVLEGAFGSVLRSECEKLSVSDAKTEQNVDQILSECVQMSMEYLRNDSGRVTAAFA